MSDYSEKDHFFQEMFVRLFYRILHIVKIHHENNQMIVESCEKFIRLIRKLGNKQGELILQSVRGKLYIDEEKLIYRRENINIYDQMTAYLEKRGLQGLKFYTPHLKDDSIRDILDVAMILNCSEQQKEPPEWLDHQLQKHGLLWCGIIAPEIVMKKQREDKRERLLKTYTYALASVEEIVTKLSVQNRAGIGKTLRVAQSMVDLMSEDEPLFLALSTIRVYDDYTYRHSLNVAILSMCLGKRIGLSRKSLERLGLCGMLHDLGKIEVPKNILNKAGKLTDEEFEEMKKHAMNSVCMIVKVNASPDRKARLLLPPFEHHLKFDLSGYPQTTRKEPISLFGRIIAIADVYDAVTSPRIYRRFVMPPDQALGMMLKGAGKDFDPILLKVFINMMGAYPVGTLLKLDTGEFGLVAENPGNGKKSRPIVVLLYKNGDFRKGATVDLNEKVAQTGKYLRNIVRTFHPADYNIQPAEFLF